MMMMMTSSTTSAATTACSTLTDCSSMQGSTTSSAGSDVMTLTTTAASSWCAIPGSSRLRVLRLVRPHQRRLMVVPEHSAAFGFAVRGGKEYGTGFFVSHVEHGGEAQLKGLRIGDQILRINGFRLDDAVHREFIQLVASQDRIILKVRGVGMLPVKEQSDERLSWNVVKMPSISGTPSESSFKTCSVERRVASRDINVVLHVAPRTKLGLGICKGPEWKPGIFVQFTKERSVAREAGLRPGDQILSVNSIDFSDVLFSEAVAVMKGGSKLDMIVRTAAGCDLFPGESSGYNSSASSVTGDQSPCWADAKSKRLTAVREEPAPSAAALQAWAQGVEVHKQLNKTIIKLTENGTSINNTYIASNAAAAGYVNQAPPPPPPQTQQAEPGKQRQLSSSHSTTSRSTIKRNTARSGSSSANVAATVSHSPAHQQQQPSIASIKSENSDGGAGVAGGGGGAGSTLTSAITEELKKRKEKQQRQQQQGSCNSNNNNNKSNSHFNRDRDEDRPYHNGNHNIGAGSGSLALARQVSHKQRLNSVSASSSGNSNGTNTTNGGNNAANNGGDQHTALMDEFKRAHQRMFRNGFHESEHKERGETLKRTSIMPDESCYRNSSCNNNNNNNNNRQTLPNGNNNSRELPPPPPQFANPELSHKPPTPATLKLNGTNNKAKQQLTSPVRSTPTSGSTTPLSASRNAGAFVTVSGLRPPATPAPDYDGQSQNDTAQSANQRRTMRLGTVTIGEYSDQRKRETLQRTTLKKTPNGTQQQQQEHQLHCNNYESSSATPVSNGILKNGNRSSASFNSRQHTEKSIKFGN